MGVNWVTLVAQLINLFVLVWLLKRFLYHPILSAVEKRQQVIMDKVNQAHDEYEKAKKSVIDLEKQKQDFVDEKARLFEQAYTQAQQVKEDNLAEIALLKEKGIDKLTQELKAQKKSLALDIENLVVTNFMTLSHQLVHEFGALTPMDNVIHQLNKKVQDIDAGTRKMIKMALKQKPEIIITSSTDLLPEQIKQMQNLIEKSLMPPKKTDYIFKTNTDLLLGIEMQVGDLLIEWHLKSYLSKIHDNIKKELIEKLA